MGSPFSIQSKIQHHPCPVQTIIEEWAFIFGTTSRVILGLQYLQRSRKVGTFALSVSTNAGTLIAATIEAN